MRKNDLKSQTADGLKNIMDILNILGNTPWRIHEDILKVMQEAWNRNMSIGGFCPAVELVIPPKPSNYDAFDHAEKKKYHNNVNRIKQDYYNLKSIRASEIYKLEIAKSVNLKF